MTFAPRKYRTRWWTVLIAVPLALLASAAPERALGANYTWSVDNSTNWNVPASWASGSFPNLSGDTALFSNAISAPRIVTVTTSTITVGTLTFDTNSATKTYEIASTVNPLKLQVGAGSAAITVNSSNQAQHLISAPLRLFSNVNVTNDSSSALTISGLIDENVGPFTFTKSGTGRVVLSNSNSYSGLTTVAGGVLELTAADATGTGNITVDSGATLRVSTSGRIADIASVTVNGTLELQATTASETIAGLNGSGIVNRGVGTGTRTLIISSASSSAFSGVIQDDGTAPNALALTKNGNGTLTLSGGSANTFVGVTTINGGTLLLNKTAGVDAIKGNVTVGDASGADVLQLAASNQINDGATLTFNAAGIFRLANNNETVAGITGAGIIENESGSAATGTLTVNYTNTGSDITYGGNIRNGDGFGTDGTLALTKTGNGTLILSGINTYSGQTTVAGGVLELGSSDATGTGALTINSGAKLRLAGGTIFDTTIVDVNGTLEVTTTTGDNIGGLTGTGTVNRGGATGTKTLIVNSVAPSTFNGVIQDDGTLPNALSITKTGASTFTLAGSAANTYSGATLINQGTLILGKTAGIDAIKGNLTIGGGPNTGLDILQLAASNQINDNSVLTFNGSGANAGVFRLANNNEIVAGITSAAGLGIIENESGAAGTATLTVNETGTRDFGGILRDGDGVGTDGALAVTMQGVGGSLTLSGSSSFSGPLNVTAGTLTLSSANTFTGAANVASGGRLIVSDNNALGGTAGITTVAAGGVLELQTSISTGENIQLGGTTTGGILQATSNSTLSGVGQLSLTGNANIYAGSSANTTLTLGSTYALVGGSNSLTKTGPGVLAITTTTSVGDIFVTQGILTAAGNSALGAGSTTVVSSGATLRLEAGTDLNISEAITLNGPSVSADGALVYGGTGIRSHTLGGTLTLNSSGVQIGARNSSGNDDTLNITAQITGGFGFAQVGTGGITGAVVLSNTANNYAGATDVQNGTLRLGVAGGVLPNGTTVTLGTASTTGTLDLNGFNETVARLNLNALGSVTSGSAATLTLNDATTAVQFDSGGSITDSNVTLSLAGGGKVAVTGAASSVSNKFDLNGGTREFNVPNVAAGSDLTVQGNILTGTVQKTGDGTLQLNSTANTFTNFDVQAGTLLIASANHFPDAAALKVSGGTFDLRGADTIGSVLLSSGTLADNNSASDTLTSNNITLQGGLVSLNLAGTAGVTKNTGGTVIIEDDNSYTGGTFLNGGTLSVAALVNGGNPSPIGADTSAAANLQFSGGALQFTGGGVTTIDRAFTLNAGGGAIDVSTSGATLATTGAAVGAGGLTKTGAGTFKLSNATNSYGGNTTVTAGTLALATASNSNNIASSPVITVAFGATLDVTGLVGSRLVLASGQTIKGNGALAGSLTVGTNSFLSPGLSPGGFGTTNATYASGGTYVWEINDVNGTQGGNPGWDHHSITGSLDISANTGGNEFTIQLNGLSGTVPGTVAGFNKYSNYNWDIATAAGGITGYSVGDLLLNTANFTSNNPINGGATNGAFTVNVVGNQIRLTYTAATEPPPATAYWTGDVDAIWNTLNAGNSNWATNAGGATDTNSIPGAITNVFFAATPGAANLTNSLSGNLSINSLTFTSATTSTVTIGGANTLTIGGGGLTVQASSGAHVINTNTALGGPQSWTNNSSNTLTVGGNISNGANDLTIAGSGDITLNGILGGGAGGLIKNSTGTLTLGGANTYGGTTAVNNGTLKLGASNVLPNTAVSITGPGTLNRNGNSDTIGALTLSGSTVTGAGTLALGGTLTSTGTSSVSGGTLDLGGGSRTVDVAGALTVDDIVANGSLVKSGAGVLQLSGAGSNTFGTTNVTNGRIDLTKTSGATALPGSITIGSAGTVKFLASNQIASTADVAVAGTLDLNGFSNTIDDLSGAGTVTLGAGTLTLGGNNNNNSGSFSGGISGGGSLVKTGSGIQEFTSAQSYTGGTTINIGILRLSTSGALADTGDVSVGATGTLHLNGVSDTIDGLNGVGGGVVQFAGGVTLTVGANNDATADFGGSITGSGAFAKTGSGSQTFSGSGANTYNGLTTVQSGTLVLNKSVSDGAIPGNLTISGATVQLATNNQISNTSVVSLSSGAFSVNGKTDTVGDFTNSGGTFTTGAGSLTAANVQWQGGTNTVNTGGTFSATSLTVSGGTNNVDAGGSLTANSLSFVDGTSRVISLASDNTTPATLFLGGNVSSSALTSGTVTIQTTGGGSLPGRINLGAATRIFTVANSTGDANTDMLITANITSGAGGGLQKEGPGTLELQGVLSYSGTTAINNGELKLSVNALLPTNTDLTINSPAAFGLGAITQQIDDLSGNGTVNLGSGAQLHVGGNNNNNSGNFTGVIQGAGSVTKIGNGTQILSGPNSYAGGTTINSGVLQLGISGALLDAGDVTVNSPGTFALNGNNETIRDLLGSGSVTLGNGALTLGSTNSVSFSGGISGSGGSLVKNGSGTQEFTAAQSYTGGTTINGGTVKLTGAGALATTGDVTIGAAGTLHLNGASTGVDGLSGVAGSIVQLSSGATLTVGNNNETSAAFAGAIQGIGAFTKAGSGTQVLSGANTYNGLTTVQGGILLLNNTSTSNTTIPGNVNITGGELRLGTNNQIADTSTVTLTSGVFNLNSFSETIAAFNNNGGTFLTGGGTLTVGTMQWNGGTNTIGAGGSVEFPSLTVGGGANTVAAAGSLKVSQLSFTGALSPSISVASHNTTPGTLFLTGDVSSNLSSGSSSIANGIGGSIRGTLNLGTATRTFTVNNSTGDANTDMLISTDITSGAGGGLAKEGPGTLELSGVLSYSGTTAINNGELKLSGVAQLPTNTDLTINSPAAFGLGAITQQIDDLSGNGTVNLDPGAQLVIGGNNNNNSGNFAGVIAGGGSVTKMGSGTQILSGANTYNGGTTINNGVLKLSGSGALANTGDVTVNSPGVFDLNGNSDTIDDLFGNGSVTLGGGTLTVGGGNNNNSGTFSGAISGGSLVKTGSGTQIITSAQAYTGGTSINDGVLMLSGSGALANTGDVSVGATGTLHLNGVSNAIDGLNGVAGSTVQLTGATLTVGNNNEASANFAGAIQGSGGLTKTGSGTQSLTGGAANTYNGLTTVQNGVLALGKTGATAVAGNISVTGGELRLTANDQIANTSTATLTGGTFNLNGSSDTIGGLTNNGGTLLTGAGALTVGTMQWNSGTNTVAAGGSIAATSLIVVGGTNTVQAGGPAGGTLTVGALEFNGAGSPVLDLQSAASGNDAAELVLNGNVLATGTGSMAQIINSGAGPVRASINLGTTTHTFNVDNRDGGTGTDLYISADLFSTSGGGLSKDGPGTLELAGYLNYNGTTGLNNGELKLSGNAQLPLNTDLTINSPASFGLSGASTSQQIDDLNGNGNINFSGGATLVVGGGNNNGPAPGNFTGLIQGDGNLTKIGTGMQTLSSPNTYTGDTTIDAGVLEVTTNNALGSNAGGTIVNDGGTLLLANNVNYSTTEALTLNGAGAVGATPGALLVDGASATWAGPITIASNATIGAYNNATLTITGNIDKSGTVLSLNGNSAANNIININGGIGPNPAANSDLEVSGVTVNVNSNIDYNGPTTVHNGGILNINNSFTATTTAITVGDATPGTVHQYGNANVTGGTGVGNLNVTNGTYTLHSGTLDFQDSTGATGHQTDNGNEQSAINIAAGGTFAFNGGTLQDVSTVNPSGTFTQSGGVFVIGKDGVPGEFASRTTINGSFLQLQGAVIKLDAFGRENSDNNFSDFEPIDLLTVTGTAHLNGQIDIDFEDPSAAGGVLTLMTAGAFDIGPNFALSNGYMRIISTGPSGPGFALQALVPEPASVAVWSLVGFAGAAAAWRLRRRTRKKS